MSKGTFGVGIIGFILGVLTCGIYTVFSRKRAAQLTDYTVHDADHNEIMRVSKD